MLNAKFQSNALAAVVLAIGCLTVPNSGLAAPTAAQLDRLGKDLTPVGAEAAGNANGSIPRWEGGVVTPPAGFSPQQGHTNPFASDKPLFTITATNVEQYKDRLSPGQMALLKRYPAYKMVVYPSRRSSGYPAEVYADIKKEAGQIQLVADGKAVSGVGASTAPFPIPQNGLEAIWNNSYRYRGRTVSRTVAEAAVHVGGEFLPVRRVESLMFRLAAPADMQNHLWLFMSAVSAPSSMAGFWALMQEPVDATVQPRISWAYDPGTRRVVRSPNDGHDSPRRGIDGLSTLDDYDGFQGSPDRFNWKLIGKREMLISYNNYKLADKSLKYKDVFKPTGLSQDLVRYELHRVHVVEATLKEGQSHIYGRRVYYLDEDSWQVAHVDAFDRQGQLWRVLEQHAMQYYDAPALWSAGLTQYDLVAQRYVASAFANEESAWKFNRPMKVRDFTPGALRRMGD